MSKDYKVTLTGVTPLLMHFDNISGSEMVKKWQKDPNNKNLSVAGDDRSPAWTWTTYVYNDGEYVCMDVDCIMACLRDAGAKIKHPNGKGTMKSLTQSGIIAFGKGTNGCLGWDFCNAGRRIEWKPIKAMQKCTDFEKHEKLAESMGFELFMKRASIGFGGTKHVRVRPIFREWVCEGKIIVLDDSILDKKMLTTIFEKAGSDCGLGDWRPGCKTPGQFGRFTAKVEEE